MSWLDKLFGRRKKEVDDPLEAAGMLQALKLDMEERDQTIIDLKQKLANLQSSGSERLAKDFKVRMETILSEAALPVVQIITQEHILKVEGKQLEAEDVLTVSRRLIRLFEDAGMVIEGRVGDKVTFDPNHHEPLSSGTAISPGDTAVIRFVGASYEDKIIRKAGVEPCRDA